MLRAFKREVMEQRAVIIKSLSEVTAFGEERTHALLLTFVDMSRSSLAATCMRQWSTVARSRHSVVVSKQYEFEQVRRVERQLAK